MEEERRRRRSLTPLESELQPPPDWTPPGPLAEQHRAKPEKAPPTTGGMLAQGMKRFLVLAGALAGAAVLVAVVIEYFSGAAPGAVFPTVFYVAGALIMAGGVYMTLEGPGWVDFEHGIEQDEKENWITEAIAPVALGLTLIGAGVALELLIY